MSVVSLSHGFTTPNILLLLPFFVWTGSLCVAFFSTRTTASGSPGAGSVVAGVRFSFLSSEASSTSSSSTPVTVVWAEATGAATTAKWSTCKQFIYTTVKLHKIVGGKTRQNVIFTECLGCLWCRNLLQARDDLCTHKTRFWWSSALRKEIICKIWLIFHFFIQTDLLLVISTSSFQVLILNPWNHSEKTNKKQQQLRSNMSLQEKQTHLCHLPAHRQPTGKSHSLHPEVWDIRKTLDLCLALPSELLVCTPSNQVVQYCLCQVICGRWGVCRTLGRWGACRLWICHSFSFWHACRLLLKLHKNALNHWSPPPPFCMGRWQINDR